MNASFWVGLGIGAALSLLASVVANLSHLKIASYLDSRKLLSREKQRKRAEEEQAAIIEMREGRRDKYLHTFFFMTSVINGGVAAFVSLVGLVLLVGLGVKLDDDGKVSGTVAQNFGLLFSASMLIFMCMVGLFLMGRGGGSLHRVRDALEDYEKYEAEYRARWGEPPS